MDTFQNLLRARSIQTEISRSKKGESGCEGILMNFDSFLGNGEPEKFPHRAMGQSEMLGFNLVGLCMGSGMGGKLELGQLRIYYSR